MEPYKIVLFFVGLLIIEDYVISKIQSIGCSVNQKQEQIEILIDPFKFYLLAIISLMPLYYIFQQFFKRKLYFLEQLFIAIFYLVINVLILQFEFFVIGKTLELFKIENIYVGSFQDRDCNTGKLFYILSIGRCSIWQFQQTIFFLLQNKKLILVIRLYGGLGFFLRLILVIISIMCIFYSLNIMLLELTRLIAKSQFLSQSIQQNEQIQFYIFYISFIIAQILLLILQLLEVFTPIWTVNKKQLNAFIFYGFITSLLVIFSPFLYEKFFILYFIIQINSYQSFILTSVQNNQNIYNNQHIGQDYFLIDCVECQGFITLNQSIVYFMNERQFFHQECYNEQQIINNQFQNIKYYLVDLSKTSQEWYQQRKLNISILYILNFLTILHLMMDNTNVLQQSTQHVNIFAQFTIKCLSIIFHKRKMTSINCFLQMVVLIFYCINLSSIYTIYEQNQQNFIKSFPSENIQYLDQFNNNIYLFIYNILITLIQAYQLSYFIIFERIQRGMHKVIFFAFILMNIQSIVFLVYKVQFNYISGLYITIYLLNLWFLIHFISKKLYNLNNYKIYQKKIFTIKVIALGIILILGVFKLKFHQTEDQYYDFQILYRQVKNNEIVKFSYIIINFQFIFYLFYLYCQEAIQFQTNKFNRFLNLEELERPFMYDENCSRCLQIFQSGQVVYYNSGCQHSIHRQCIRIKWMNYQWCCQDSGNKVIEIHLN